MDMQNDCEKRVVFRRDDDSDCYVVGTAIEAREALRERQTCDECYTWDYDSLARFTTDEGDGLWTRMLCSSCHPDTPVA